MIRFGSRGSDLALAQTRMVAESLARRCGIEYRIEVIETRGDRILDQALPQIGGKGVFTAELEAALRERRIDAAVHSMKDLPVADPDGLTVGAVPERRAPADVLVYDPRWADPAAAGVPLRSGCRIGTSSHRRRSALERLRGDLEFADIRGNVPTRVDKVRRGDYGAVVLARAGLDRLQLALDGLSCADLPVSLCTPAPSQGALAVQCRSDDEKVLGLLARLHDAAAARCAHAERDVLFRLGGGCSMPLGVLVTEDDAASGAGRFRLQAALYTNPEDGAAPSGLFLDLRGEAPEPLAEQVAARWRPLVGSPLRGRRIVTLRPDGHGSDLDAAFAVAGANVHNVPLTRVVPLPPPSLEVALDGSLDGRALAFTSARAVELFCAAAAGLNLRGRRVFAGGPATAAMAEVHGMTPLQPHRGSGGRALAERIATEDLPPGGVLFPCAVERHPELEAALQQAGVAVTPLPLYRTEALPSVDLDLPSGTIVVFTSPSAVRAFAAEERAPARHVAIGRSTAAAMDSAGVRCDGVADEPTPEELIRCCQELSDA